MFPIHVQIGDFFIPFYEGAYFMLSILFGLVLGTRVLERRGKKEDEYWNILFGSIIGAIAGGRLFHVLFWNFGYYLANPLKIFAIWEGGISITGGIAGALLAALFLCRARRTGFWSYLAPLSPVILLAQGLGRIGCFMNGDAFGVASNLPWAVSFRRFGIELFSGRIDASISSSAWNWCYANGLVVPDSMATVPMHPTQLYEALFDLALATLLAVLLKKGIKDRIVGSAYIAGYSLFRFFVEYIRADREQVILWNTSAIQFVLFAVALGFCAFIVVEALRRQRKDGNAPPEAPS